MTLALARKDSLPALGGGQPLPAPLKAQMESGFGQDFSAIRVHDNARAHDAARQLDARAFAAGNDIAFASGAWQPESASGRALIAHELAHSVQQAGVQMKRGSPVGSDSRLEAEADSAAEAVMAGRTPPPLTVINRPLVLRNPATQPAPTAPPAPRLPVDVDGMKIAVKTDTPPGVGTEVLDLWVDKVTLVNSKGGGDWVPRAWSKATSADPEALLFAPILSGNNVQAFKEDSGTEEYLGNWLTRNGFSSMAELSKAITESSDTEVVKLLADKPEVATLAKALAGGLSASKMAIDHIVEKQVGGTSLADNLQLLTGDTNSKAGTDLNKKLTAIIRAVRLPNHRGPQAKKIRLYLKQVEMGPGAPDASAAIEGLLQSGKVKGTVATKAAAGLKPVDVSGGGGRMATLYVDDARKTEVAIDDSQRRLVPGMKLTKYKRNAVKGKPDEVKGELDHKMMKRTGAADGDIALLAEMPAAPPAPVAAPAGTPPPTPISTNEQRTLKLKTNNPKGLGFHYPYLSPGTISTLDTDATGQLIGTAVITPSVKFLGPLNVKFGPDTLALDMTLDHEAINKSTFMTNAAGVFRLTGGSVSINLMEFKPEGSLQFSVGPKTKPFINGDLKVALDNGVFIASGALTPARAIPGIKEAEGTVSYRGDKGWTGSLKAKSATFAASEVTAELGFTSNGWTIVPSGSGHIRTDVRGNVFNLGLTWDGGYGISYAGGVTVPNPLPLVSSVDLDGTYTGSTLKLTGKADIKWKGQGAKMAVTYVRVDGQEGSFSGTADVTFTTGKLLGTFNLGFGEKGLTSGGGELTYEVTPQFKPKLAAKREGGKWKLSGEATLGPYTLLEEWPQKGGKKIEIIKGLGVTIPIPLPVSPALTGYAYLRGSLGFRYGLGPAVLKDVVLNASLFPFEDDMQLAASAKATLEAPFYAELEGTFGAGLGVAVPLNLAGLRGGVDLSAKLSLPGKASATATATYSAADGFTFKATAGAEMSPEVSLGVDLEAAAYALGGLLEYKWTYPVASLNRKLGPTFKLTIGELVYNRNGLTLPDLSSIDYSPKEFDPMKVVEDVVSGGQKS